MKIIKVMKNKINEIVNKVKYNKIKKSIDNSNDIVFVDLGARCWFQKFLDDGVNEREYLMTEGEK